MATLREPDRKVTHIGICREPEDATVAIALLDQAHQRIAVEAFELDTLPISEYLPNPDLSTFVETPDLQPVRELLSRFFQHGLTAGLLVEAEIVLSIEGAPAGVFRSDSPQFRLTCYVPFIGINLTFAYYEVPERDAIVVHHAQLDAPPEPGSHAPQPRFLTSAALSCYAEALLDSEPTLEQRAVVAALLSKNHGAYYFWSSFGEPPSSGDILQHVELGQARMLVGTPTETFAMRIRTTSESLPDCALDFAVLTKKWEALGQKNAHKAALVHVSKLNDFDIRCYSNRVDATGRDPRLVWPLPKEDEWIIRALRSGTVTRRP